jgi:hypothetical protein
VSRFAVVLAVLLVSRAAGAADVCPRGNEPAAGPLAGGIGPADFGAVPEACGATDASLRLRTELVDASTMPDYYGRFIGAATLRGRYQLGERSTFSFAADAFNYRYINDGGLASHGVSAGPATAAFHQMFVLGAETAMSLYARLLLPLDSARQGGVATGLELGSSLRIPAGARWVIDGGVALTAPAGIVGGQTHVRFEPAALAEAWLRLRPGLALCGGAHVRLAVAPEFYLATAVPRLGARFALRRRVWAAALLEFPVAGTDRTDLIAGLFAGYTPN